jgi:hypothetical protein
MPGSAKLKIPSAKATKLRDPSSPSGPARAEQFKFGSKITPEMMCDQLAGTRNSKKHIDLLWSHVMRRAQEVLPDDLSEVTVTSAQLTALFDIIDEVHFSGRIMDAIKQNGYTFVIKPGHGKGRKVAGFCQKIGCNYKIELGMGIFKSINSKRKTNGIICHTALECLMSTLAHEMVHLLCYVFCEKKERGHGKIFQAIALNLFGHTAFRHSLSDEVFAEDRMVTRDTCRVGMTLMKHHKGQSDVGVVIKCNPKRAKMRFADGKIWVVPYGGLWHTDAHFTPPPAPAPDGDTITRATCRVGSTLIMRRSGEKDILGAVVYCNPKRAKMQFDQGIMNVPYVLLRHTDKHYTPPSISADQITRAKCRVGMEVTIRQKDKADMRGVVLKCNPTRARMEVGEKKYTVPYELLWK